MKSIKLSLVIVFLSFFLCPNLLKAQFGNCFGTESASFYESNESILAREKYTLMSDDIDAKNYKNASHHLYWLLVNVPELNPALYRKGIVIYKELAQNTTDQHLEKSYEDSIIVLYDLWVHYFQHDKVNALNSKGELIFELWQNNPERYSQLFSLYSEIFSNNGVNNRNYNLQYLMYFAVLEYKEGNLSKEEVADLYQKILEILEIKSSTDKEHYSKWEETRNYIAQLNHIVSGKEK